MSPPLNIIISTGDPLLTLLSRQLRYSSDWILTPDNDEKLSLVSAKSDECAHLSTESNHPGHRCSEEMNRTTSFDMKQDYKHKVCCSKRLKKTDWVLLLQAALMRLDIFPEWNRTRSSSASKTERKSLINSTYLHIGRHFPAAVSFNWRSYRCVTWTHRALTFRKSWFSAS